MNAILYWSGTEQSIGKPQLHDSKWYLAIVQLAREHYRVVEFIDPAANLRQGFELELGNNFLYFRAYM